MNITIRGDHVKITESIKAYVEEKFSKLNKYFDDSQEIDVIVKIRLKGNDQIIEVTIPTKLFTIRAEESNADLYAAIDLVIALLVYEQSIRDASYNDLFCRFTEVYKSKGGVF